MKNIMTVAKVLDFMETHSNLFEGTKIKVYDTTGKEVYWFHHCDDIVTKTELNKSLSKIHLKKSCINFKKET